MKRITRGWKRFIAQCAHSSAVSRLERERDRRREAMTAIREGCR